MKAKLFSLIFSICLFLCACVPEAEAPLSPEAATLPQGISISVDTETITPEGADFLLLQTLGGDIQYGDDFRLETLTNGGWQELPHIIDNAAFHSIAYALPKNVSQTIELDWAWLYGSLPAGDYRLVKTFIDYHAPGDYDTYTIAAAFTIE